MAVIVIKFYKISIFICIIILSSLFIINGCAGYELFIPEYHELSPPPEEVNIRQLYSDYMADEAIADVNYKGERLVFYEVEVEQVLGYWIYIGHGNWIYENTSFISESVKFELRKEDYGIMQNIEKGYILNIVGECQGLIFGGYNREPLIFINECWVESVSGDLGTAEWEPPSY